MNIDDIISNPVSMLPDMSVPEQKIHIHMKQRNSRQSQTMVDGFASDMDIKKIAKAMRKSFSCMASVCHTSDKKEYILLSGDQRDAVKNFLITNDIAKENDIIKHGH